MRLISFLALSSLATAGVIGCRSDSKNTTDGNTNGDGTGSGGDVKIQDVQNDQMPPGTPVTLRGVVVTAIDNFGAKVGDIWVEEPEGGTYSGVHVFGATTTDVGALAVGDLVDVTGAVKDEFAYGGGSNGSGDTSGRTVTELKPASAGSLSVKKVGTGTLPAPVMVDALMIGQMSDADTQGPMFSAAWEPYEGVLVSIPSVSAVGAPKAFGAKNPDQYSFNITGVAKVESNMADVTMSNIGRNSCLNMTGVVDYFFDYLVLPRSAADIDTNGTNCPALETSCADMIDNDGNGFNDCSDNNCIITASATGGNLACKPATATISSIDTAVDANPASPTLPTTNIEIDDVYVTAIAGTDFWVASSLTAGANGGLYVFSGGQPLASGLAVGAKVNVIGKMQAYKASATSTEVLPELNLLAATVVTAAGTQPTASTQTPATLNVAATGRPWVGSLVTIQGKNKVTVAQSMTNHYTGTLTNGATPFEYLGQIVKDTNGAVNTCYGDITGIWTWDGFNSKYALVPTTIPATTTGCP